MRLLCGSYTDMWYGKIYRDPEIPVVTALSVSGRKVSAAAYILNIIVPYGNKSLTYDSRFQIDKDSAWYMFASSRLAEESIEGVITSSNGLITRHLTIRLYTVFKAVQLPACIAHLHTSLANVDRDTLTLENQGLKTFCKKHNLSIVKFVGKRLVK